MASPGHSHGYAHWPFPDPEELGVFLCDHVFDRLLPVLFVVHDHDGDWQFLCGEHDHAEGKPHLVCFGCMITRDPTLAELADMPRGWGADRSSATEDWHREPVPVPEDPEQ